MSRFRVFYRIKFATTIICFSVQFGFAQTDSSEIEIIPILKELDKPTILIDTGYYGLKDAFTNGFELLKIVPQACDLDNYYDKIDSFKELPAINSFQYFISNDSLIIDYSVFANCCSNFVGAIAIDRYMDKKVLLIELYEYGYECECNCCFNIQFYIRKSNENDIDDFFIFPSMNGIMIEQDEDLEKY